MRGLLEKKSLRSIILIESLLACTCTVQGVGELCFFPWISEMKGSSAVVVLQVWRATIDR